MSQNTETGPGPHRPFAWKQAEISDRADPANVTDLVRMMSDHTFADSWERPGLDRRGKVFAALAFLIARGGIGLATSVEDALDEGIAPGEIVEVLIHAAGYLGTVPTEEARRQVREVFAQRAQSA